MSSKSKNSVPKLTETSNNNVSEISQIIENLDDYIALSNALFELSECKLPEELILKTISKELKKRC